MTDPVTEKITLVEIDIGQDQDFFTNYKPFTWFVNFGVAYPDIDSSLLVGVDSKPIVNVGSMKEDGVPLIKQTSIANVQANQGTFFFDITANNLYVHCYDSNQPWTHEMFIGVVFGYSNIDRNFVGINYETRVERIPSLKQSKDPLYFGKLNFQAGNITLTNNDGFFDTFGEDNDVFGNDARVLIGFDDQEYLEYEQLFSGYIENLSIDSTKAIFKIQDKRKQLSRALPPNIFDITTYPDLKEANIDKPIPLAFGEIRNAPVICTNEEEAPLPANYSFKICDTTNRSIKSIDNVIVEGSTKIPVATDLTNGTFTLSNADYTKGNDVTVYFSGYVDDDGVLIENGMDIIQELFLMYTDFPYNSDVFNISEWETAKLKAVDLCYFLNEEKKMIDVIEELSFSLQAIFFVQNDGKFTDRIYDGNNPSVQYVFSYELMETPKYEYNSNEVTTRTIITFDPDWENTDNAPRLVDKSQEEEIFDIIKTRIPKTFDTVIKNRVDVQSFSDSVLDIAGEVQRKVTIKTKMQLARREIGDFITVEIYRANSEMLGIAKIEILDKNVNLTSFDVTITGRILEIEPETISQTATYWGATYWKGNYWGKTEDIEV